MLIDFSVWFLNYKDWQAVLFSSFAVTQQDTEAAIENNHGMGEKKMLVESFSTEPVYIAV